MTANQYVTHHMQELELYDHQPPGAYSLVEKLALILLTCRLGAIF